MRDVPVPFAGQHSPFVSTVLLLQLLGSPAKTSDLITLKKVLFCDGA